MSSYFTINKWFVLHLTGTMNGWALRCSRYSQHQKGSPWKRNMKCRNPGPRMKTVWCHIVILIINLFYNHLLSTECTFIILDREVDNLSDETGMIQQYNFSNSILKSFAIVSEAMIGDVNLFLTDPQDRTVAEMYTTSSWKSKINEIIYIFIISVRSWLPNWLSEEWAVEKKPLFLCSDMVHQKSTLFYHHNVLWNYFPRCTRIGHHPLRSQDRDGQFTQSGLIFLSRI